MAYSKQTWDTTSYVNPTRMNHIEDGIADADLTNHGITLPNKTGTLALLSDVAKKEVIDGANVARTITFSGKTWTRRVSLILILAGQSGVGAPISISFGGFTGYNDIGNVFTSDPSIITNGSSITVPNFGGEWGLHTIIKLYDDELTWTVT